MFITLQLVEFYYNFIIILSTTIRLIFIDLEPRIFKICRLQIFFNFYDEECFLTEVGYFSLLSGYRHYHMARKDKITRYYQSLMTWYILSVKEMRIGNKMVQGNGIRKIFCQLSFPDLIFSNVKMSVNNMLSVGMIYMSWKSSNYFWFMSHNFWLDTWDLRHRTNGLISKLSFSHQVNSHQRCRKATLIPKRFYSQQDFL